MDHPAVSIAREALRARLERARVVHQQEVDVWSVKVAQRVVQRAIDIVRVVVIAPQLRS